MKKNRKENVFGSSDFVLRNSFHIPVLQKEVLKYLDPKPNEGFIDATCGFAGHAKEILQRNKPNGRVLGIEVDQVLYQKLRAAKVERLVTVQGSYAELKKIVQEEKFQRVAGILFDLGMSSWHLESSGRGFSFQKNEPLIMRYDDKSQEYLTAEEIVNCWPEEEIANILGEYGQEQFAERIAKGIIEARKIKPIKTTFQLVEIIKESTPHWYLHRKIHPATKTFQALRIAVNDELNNVKKGLESASEVLKKGGRLVVISFHSLEDGLVKNFFKKASQEGRLKILTKKPVRPSRTELAMNPRARSARLRAAIKSFSPRRRVKSEA